MGNEKFEHSNRCRETKAQNVSRSP